jgi:FAD dependent oxidoreductase TIGR03364
MEHIESHQIMPVGRDRFDVDLCVVGAGIVGLAHALEGRRRGLRVAVLERRERAVGASVRNFGHAFISSLGDGSDLACALRARERWLDLAERAGLHLREAGTLVVARADDEMAVLEGAAGNPARSARVLTASEAGELAPIPTEGIVGAIHCAQDLRVDPRGAVAGLARLLESDPDAIVRWGEPVHSVEPGAVHGQTVTVGATAIAVCPGPEYGSLPPGLRDGLEGLTLCKLQMLRVAAPGENRYGPALATGLSTIRYPAFTGQPASELVRARLMRERPELVEAGIHLLITQLPNGDLVIGDTHEYGDTPTPFGEERLYGLLLDEAASLLGADTLEVRQRWIGIYPTLAAGAHNGSASHADGGGNFLVTAPCDGVRVVEATTGLGMTLSHGFAGTVLDDLGS